jgi:hypothetical protein
MRRQPLEEVGGTHWKDESGSSALGCQYMVIRSSNEHGLDGALTSHAVDPVSATLSSMVSGGEPGEDGQVFTSRLSKNDNDIVAFVP